MPKPTISVLMPVKDGAATVLTAVRSTLFALPSDGELLVVDDGSSDATPSLLKSIRDSRLTVIRQDSEGVARSLNTLLKLARSDVIARMDADDICLPWRFRLQQRMFEKYRADLVFGSFVRLIAGKGLRPSPPRALSGVQMQIALAIGNPFAHSTMYGNKRTILQAGGYSEVLAEDYELWLRLASAGRSLVLGRAPVIILRQHSRQVTADVVWQANAGRDRELISSYVGHSRLVLSSLKSTQPLELSYSSFGEARAAVISRLYSQTVIIPTMGHRAFRSMAKKERISLPR